MSSHNSDFNLIFNKNRSRNFVLVVDFMRDYLGTKFSYTTKLTSLHCSSPWNTSKLIVSECSSLFPLDFTGYSRISGNETVNITSRNNITTNITLKPYLVILYSFCHLAVKF